MTLCGKATLMKHDFTRPRRREEKFSPAFGRMRGSRWPAALSSDSQKLGTRHLERDRQRTRTSFSNLRFDGVPRRSRLGSVDRHTPRLKNIRVIRSLEPFRVLDNISFLPVRV